MAKGIDCLKIYMADLSANFLPDTKTILSAKDYTEASRYSNPAKCELAIRSRIIRRQILSHELQCPAAELDFVVKNGKPGLANERRLQFSTSYSGSLMALAIFDKPIGVDLEEIDDGASNEDVVDALFHVEEIQQISRNSSVDKIKTFYAIWTQKEAFAKALGQGMEIEFRNFAVLLDGGIVTCESGICNGRTWYTKPVQTKGDFTLSIASNSFDPQIVVLDWPTKDDQRLN